MSSIDVKNIAYLARIAMPPQELADTEQKLQQIFALIDHLQAQDTRNIEPMAHPLALAQRSLPDVVTESDQRDKFQALAPATELGCYLVPIVIE